MTKREFLDLLESSLKGQIPPSAVASNLQYYRDYIAGEVAKGRSEESVLEELGDPRLIARTILSAAGAAGERGFEESGRETGRRGRNSYQGNQNGRSSHGSAWKWILLLLVVMLLILSFVTRVIFLVVRLLLSPIFWVFIVLAFGAGYFFRRR